MVDLGAPGSFLTLEKGMPVYASCGEKVGEVQRILAAPEEDIFDGFVLDTSALPGGLRFVDASLVAEIYERGVELSIDAAACERLPKPTDNQ